MFDLVMAQFSGGGTIISNLFQGRLQYAAGMSIVNIKPKQLGICFVLFMVIFGDNQTRIHHTLQIPPTMETHKATQTLFYFLATGRTHPHRSTHTHTHADENTHKLEAQRSVQVEQNRNSPGYKRGYSAISGNTGGNSIKFLSAEEMPYTQYNLLCSDSIMLSQTMNHNEKSLRTTSIFRRC